MIPGKVDTLENVKMTGTVSHGLEIQTRDGRPAELVIIDEAGNVIESGRHVAREIWNVVMQIDCNFYHGCGYLTVHSTPPDLPEPQPQSEQNPLVSTQDNKGKGREGA